MVNLGRKFHAKRASSVHGNGQGGKFTGVTDLLWGEVEVRGREGAMSRCRVWVPFAFGVKRSKGVTINENHKWHAQIWIQICTHIHTRATAHPSTHTHTYTHTPRTRARKYTHNKTHVFSHTFLQVVYDISEVVASNNTVPVKTKQRFY